MSIEENKALIHRYLEEVQNKGNFDAVDKFFAVDGIDHNAPPDSPPGLGFMKQVHTIVRAAFPDVRVTVRDFIAEGDKGSVPIYSLRHPPRRVHGHSSYWEAVYDDGDMHLPHQKWKDCGVLGSLLRDGHDATTRRYPLNDNEII